MYVCAKGQGPGENREAKYLKQLFSDLEIILYCILGWDFTESDAGLILTVFLWMYDNPHFINEEIRLREIKWLSQGHTMCGKHDSDQGLISCSKELGDKLLNSEL